MNISLRATAPTLAALTTLLLLAGCGGLRPKPAKDARTPPAPAQRPAPPDSQPLAPLPDTADCACTLEYRYNVCLTVNNRDTLPPDVTFIRQREDGTADLLETHPRCFGEWRRGLQRILALRGGVAVDSSGWFETPTVDCCHGAAKTLDFRLDAPPLSP